MGAKAKSMDHLDNKLSMMLEQISMEKEMKAAKDTEAMKAAETEVAAHMDAVIEQAKTSDGWDINDVVNNVNVHVSKVLDAHGIDDAVKEKSMEHLDNKLSKMLNLISAEKEMKEAQDHEAMKAAETEVAAHMKQVIEHAESTDGWDINDVVNNVNGHVSKVLDANGIDDEAKLKSMDHLDNMLSDSLEQILVEKEMKAATDAEAMKAAETEVAAHMEQVIERAKTSDGWDINDVVNKVNGHVSKVLDAHSIDDAAKEKTMDHLDNKLSMILEEISVEKEMKAAKHTEAMKAAETEVASHMERVIEHAKTTDGWDINDVVSKVNGHVSKVLDSHGIDGAAKEISMEHLDNKLSNMLEEISVEKISAETDWDVNF